MSFYNGARVLFSPLLRLIFGIKRTGVQNMPLKGPVIVCSNHRSNFDPVVLGCAINRELKYMAKAELFKNPPLRLLITALGAFPVNRGAGDAAAVNKAISILKEGKVLAMFPEGKRNITGGELRRFQSGAARFALKAHAAIVPVAIASKGRVRPFKRNRVIIGKAITFEQLGITDGGSENIHQISDMLRDRVAELLAGAGGPKSV